MRLLNRLEEVRLVYNVVYACCLCTNTMMSCVLSLLFVNHEHVKRKKEGLKLDKNGEKYVQK